MLNVCAPACEMNTSCDLSEDEWKTRVQELYPDFQGKLCPDGNFERMIMAMARPWYDIVIRECGLCDFDREISPFRACCTLDDWLEEFGVPEDCFDSVCFASDQDYKFALRAQMHVKARMEYGAIQDADFWRWIAGLFNINITLDAPTLIGEGNTTPTCDTMTAWVPPAQYEPDNVGESPGLAGVSFPQGCAAIPHQFIIRMTAAPQTLVNYANCGVAGQPIAYNWYVEAFMCLVRLVKPFHVSVCFLHDYTTDRCVEHANPNPAPTFIDPCQHTPKPGLC